MVPALIRVDDRIMNHEEHQKEEPMDSGTQTQEGPNPAWQLPVGMRPPLLRSRTDRKIAGVAGGIAAHLGVDPLWIRVAFVALSFAGGLGVLLYVIGWALIPEEGAQAAAGEGFLDYLRRAPSWLPIALLVLAGLVFFGNSGGPRVFWAAALIAGGIWLYRNDARHDEPPTGPPVGGLASALVPEVTSPVASTGSVDVPPPPVPDVAPVTYAPSVPRPYYPPRPPRPRSFLARYTLAAMLVVLGVAGALDNVGAFRVPARVYPALALLVVAAGLVVGAFWGRSRLLILAGLVILPVALVSSLVRVPIRGGTGDRVFAPTSVQSVSPEYRLAAGHIRLDLTDLQWGSSSVSTRIRVAAGQIDVIVPDDVTVDFHGHAGAGEIDLPGGVVRNGVDVTLQTAIAGSQPTAPHLNLDAEVSLGQIHVERGPSPALPVPPAVPSAP
jgi:phage shock protein PspC (stress-responsive transcriptional regulator)